jgi:hypothetical protein
VPDLRGTAQAFGQRRGRLIMGIRKHSNTHCGEGNSRDGLYPSWTPLHVLSARFPIATIGPFRRVNHLDVAALLFHALVHPGNCCPGSAAFGV